MGGQQGVEAFDKPWDAGGRSDGPVLDGGVEAGGGAKVVGQPQLLVELMSFEAADGPSEGTHVLGEVEGVAAGHDDPAWAAGASDRGGEGGQYLTGVGGALVIAGAVGIEVAVFEVVEDEDARGAGEGAARLEEVTEPVVEGSVGGVEEFVGGLVGRGVEEELAGEVAQGGGRDLPGPDREPIAVGGEPFEEAGGQGALAQAAHPDDRDQGGADTDRGRPQGAQQGLQVAAAAFHNPV